MQRYLRVIDERLSELYSIQGKHTTRGGIITSADGGAVEGSGTNPALIDQSNNGSVFGTTNKVSGFRPVSNAMYRDMVPIGFASTNADGTERKWFNCFVDSLTAPNVFNYKLRTGAQNITSLAVIGTVHFTASSDQAIVLNAQPIAKDQIKVSTALIEEDAVGSDTITRDYYLHYIWIFGLQ